MKTPLLFACCVAVCLNGFGQSISPASGNTTVCPDNFITYTITPSPSFHGCGTFTWTLSNGTFVSGQNVTVKTTNSATFSVDVIWNNAAGNGTLTVTSACTEGTMSVSQTYAINSLNGRTLSNPQAYQTLSYCSSASIHLGVDVMYLLNTGGATGIPQQQADGYEWTLPTGWRNYGTAGTISTTTPFIDIAPDDGCYGGSVSVKAYMQCTSGKKYSNASTISVARPTPALTITAPGYSSSSCGSGQQVTFTVTPVACASNYTWTFSGPNSSTPSGWLTTPASSGTNNYITVTASGTYADAGSVIVTVTLDCSTQLQSLPFTLSFTPPTISIGSSNAICYSGTTVTLSNVSTAVTWTVSSAMTIVSGQGTSTAVIRPITSTKRDSGTIDASVGCPGVTVPTKTVWAGKPLIEGTMLGGGLLGSSPLINNVPTLQNYVTVMNISGDNTKVWQRTAANPTNTTWALQGDGIRSYFFAANQTATYRLTATNTCGPTTLDYNFRSTGGSGGCNQYTVSPNPSGSVVNIVVPNIPPPCSTLALVASDSEQSGSSLTIKSINLYSGDGQVVRSQQFDNDVKNINLDINGIPAGTYLLKISNGTYVETQRIYVK